MLEYRCAYINGCSNIQCIRLSYNRKILFYYYTTALLKIKSSAFNDVYTAYVYVYNITKSTD